VINNYQDGVAQRHQRSLLAPAGGYPSVLGHQVGAAFYLAGTTIVVTRQAAGAVL